MARRRHPPKTCIQSERSLCGNDKQNDKVREKHHGVVVILVLTGYICFCLRRMHIYKSIFIQGAVLWEVVISMKSFESLRGPPHKSPGSCHREDRDS